jgi:uncharacterized protein (TIGR03083 family)
MSLAAHVDAVRAAAARLGEAGAAAGLSSRVPTCRGWRVRDLVAHQGMVHRWATSQLAGDRAPTPSKTQILATVREDALLDWFAEGVTALLTTIERVDDEVSALVFLRDAPPPRRFWARRQAHETTIHSVDAVSARLRRFPLAADIGVEQALALDGIDELVCGFVPRGTSKLVGDRPYTIMVAPTDSSRRWTMSVGATSVETATGGVDDPDVTFAGTATQLYLGLWNRGEEIDASGLPGVLDRWRAAVRVSW